MDAHGSLPPLKHLIAMHKLHTKKALGQHFLLDGNLTDKIARAVPCISEQILVEIGPGPTGLTRSLLQAGAKRVIAIEQDERIQPILRQLQAAYPERFSYVMADALEVNLHDLTSDRPLSIVSNLPYNIGTELLFKWLEHIGEYDSLTLMFQKEVADRLTAAPATKAYGKISVFTQWLCDVHHVMDVNPAAFSPPPKVWSSVVQLTPKTKPEVVQDRALFRSLIHFGFQQRRKMLRKVLSANAESPGELLKTAELDETKRPDQLSVCEWVRLANTAHQMGLALE